MPSQIHKIERMEAFPGSIDREQQQQGNNVQQVSQLDRAPTSTHAPPTLTRWLLLTFVVAVLSWVALMSILAGHTDVWREKIYPFFESTYFPKRSGARVFTYLGVFYILAGAVSLSCLALGVRLPGPTPWMVRSLRAPIGGGGADYWTLLDMAVLALFVAVQIAAIVTRVEKKFHNDWVYDWDAAKLWYEVTKTLGKTCALTIMFLFLPICKSCFYLDLFNVKFERAVKYHRWLAWFLVLMVLIHAATAVTSLVLAGQLKNCMWPSENCQKPGGFGTYLSKETSRMITYGWCAALVATPLVLTSVSWVRRHKFEWFYYTHFLFLPATLLLHLHYPAMIYYASPGIAAYVLDKTLWWCSLRRPIRLVSLTLPAPGFVRMEIALAPHHKYEPGSWVQVNVPAVSLLEWHPMSVASAPGHKNTITIDIKVLGDWTKRLQGLAARFDPSKPAHTAVFLDGFHGSSHTQMQGYLNHPAVLMFAGGIGITPMLSALRSLVVEQQGSSGSAAAVKKVRRVVLVWVVRRASVLDLYRQELARYQALGRTASGCEMEVLVHVTLSEQEDPADDAIVHHHSPDTTAQHDSTAPAVLGPKRYAFASYLRGYWHRLFLTVGAGGGYLLGIFLANLIAYDQDSWAPEFLNLLQLTLAVAFAGLIVAIGMSVSVCKSVPTYEEDKEHQSQTQQQVTPASTTDVEASQELNVVIGCRPDVKKIVGDMKEWCQTNGCSSVGVAVCGPDQLIQAVMKNCRQVSSSSLPFVVDDETFEW